MTEKIILERWQFEGLSYAEKTEYNAQVHDGCSISYWIQNIPYVPSAVRDLPFHIKSVWTKCRNASGMV